MTMIGSHDWTNDELLALIESAPDALVVVDGKGRIVLANAQVETLFGYARKDLLGKSVDMLVPAKYRGTHPDRRRKYAAGPKPRPMGAGGDLYAVAADGREFPVDISLSPIDTGGEVFYSASIRDITERKTVEARLRQAQKMEAVGQLTGGIAHDFNNLLAVIMGNLELVAESVEGDERVSALIGRATAAAERGGALTQRLLAYARRQVLQPQAIDANALVVGIIELLRRTLGEDIAIETTLENDLQTCDADLGQLENALLNLALNARDAMPAGGKLTIETANAELDQDYAALRPEVAPGAYVMLAVSDTGCGMPPDVVRQALEPFFTTKPVGKGTGLGLSMVYGFVKQSGGHLAIYSEEGKGTTVRLYLPRSEGGKSDAPAADADVTAMAARAGETVLVVEDDEDVRVLTAAMLAGLGYRVLGAETGAVALELLAANERVDLLLTDVVLAGGMSGKELATEVGRLRPDIAVLYMSGYTENAIHHHGRLDEDVELIAKPFRKAELARRAREIIDRGGPGGA